MNQAVVISNQCYNLEGSYFKIIVNSVSDKAIIKIIINFTFIFLILIIINFTFIAYLTQGVIPYSINTKILSSSRSHSRSHSRSGEGQGLGQDMVRSWSGQV